MNFVKILIAYPETQYRGLDSLGEFMGAQARRHGRMFMVFGMVVAGLCLIRVLTVQADEVEVYAADEHEDVQARDDREAEARAEIRLTRPEEAAARIAADDMGYDQVPGADKLWRSQKNEIAVPIKTGRKIASEPAPDVEVRDGVTATLKAEVIEPKAASTQETVAHSAPVRPSYGLKSEPAPETRIDPPLPQTSSGARAGTQEVSLIVSDYGYFPARIFVTQNVPVKIYMTTPSKNTLCFMLDSWGLKKGVTPGKVEEVTFTPESAGNYRFYCPVKSIEGTLTVREAPVAEQSLRGLAAEPKPVDTASLHNEPRNARELRAVIED